MDKEWCYGSTDIRLRKCETGKSGKKEVRKPNKRIFKPYWGKMTRKECQETPFPVKEKETRRMPELCPKETGSPGKGRKLPLDPEK